MLFFNFRNVTAPLVVMLSIPFGLIGGIWAGRMAGHENVITLDMGGTSADIGVAPGGGVPPPVRT